MPNCLSIVTARSSCRKVTVTAGHEVLFQSAFVRCLTGSRTQPLVRVHPRAEIIDNPDVMS